jgi:hypothetical protein
MAAGPRTVAGVSLTLAYFQVQSPRLWPGSLHLARFSSVAPSSHPPASARGETGAGGRHLALSSTRARPTPTHWLVAA